MKRAKMAATANKEQQRKIQHSTLYVQKDTCETNDPKGNEKQIDYILTKRKYLKYNEDAEANDMIHMGSDHRCVVATFMISTPNKSSHCKTKKKVKSIQQRKKGGIKPTKTLELGSLSSEKIPRGHGKIKEKPSTQKQNSSASKK